MKKPIFRVLFFLTLLSLLAVGMAGCGIESLVSEGVVTTATATLSPTPDRCAAANVPAEVTRLTRLMNRFDNFSVLAQASPKEQLVVVALEMYKIQSDAGDLDVPACLAKLQEEQLKFMSTVTAVLTNFLNGVSAEVLQQQIVISRGLRTNYEVELGKLLGYEYHTPTPLPTPTATQVTPTSTPAPVTVTAKKDVDIYQGPGRDTPKIGVFLTGQQANVIGRSEDFNWVLVEAWDSPDKKGWVSYFDVTVSASLIMVPVATALPAAPQ
jgi:hypothetical protein